MSEDQSVKRSRRNNQLGAASGSAGLDDMVVVDEAKAVDTRSDIMMKAASNKSKALAAAEVISDLFEKKLLTPDNMTKLVSVLRSEGLISDPTKDITQDYLSNAQVKTISEAAFNEEIEKGTTFNPRIKRQDHYSGDQKTTLKQCFDQYRIKKGDVDAFDTRRSPLVAKFNRWLDRATAKDGKLAGHDPQQVKNYLMLVAALDSTPHRATLGNIANYLKQNLSLFKPELRGRIKEGLDTLIFDTITNPNHDVTKGGGNKDGKFVDELWGITSITSTTVRDQMLKTLGLKKLDELGDEHDQIERALVAVLLHNILEGHNHHQQVETKFGVAGGSGDIYASAIQNLADTLSAILTGREFTDYTGQGAMMKHPVVSYFLFQNNHLPGGSQALRPELFEAKMALLLPDVGVEECSQFFREVTTMNQTLQSISKKAEGTDNSAQFTIMDVTQSGSRDNVRLLLETLPPGNETKEKVQSLDKLDDEALKMSGVRFTKVDVAVIEVCCQMKIFNKVMTYLEKSPLLKRIPEINDLESTVLTSAKSMSHPDLKFKIQNAIIVEGPVTGGGSD